MERQQHQHGAKQPRPPIPGRSYQQVRRRKSKSFLGFGTPLWNRSLIILGSVWVVVVLIALTAVSGLLSPNMSSNQPPGTASVRTPAATARADSQSRLPLWLFGAIAFSCAAGSMLVSKQVSRPPRPRKSSKAKRLAPYVSAETASPPFPIPSSPVEPSFALAPPPLRPTPTASPFMAPATLMQLAQQGSQAASQTTEAPASIAPEDQKPLDWGKASLADQLDIRKPRSMSSLL